MRKRRTSSGESYSGGDHHSPRHAASDEKSLQKKKKKETQRKMTLERDSKNAHDPLCSITSLQPPQFSPPKPTRLRPPLVPVQSVDIPDYTPSIFFDTHSSNDPVTSSLNLVRPPQRSASAGVNGDETTSDSFTLSPGPRVYRSYSDAHVSLPPTHFLAGRHRQPERGENIVCPTDRKRFFRSFQKALKYVAGISRPQPHPPETPFHPHMSRYHSENLGMESPQGTGTYNVHMYMHVYMFMSIQ